MAQPSVRADRMRCFGPDKAAAVNARTQALGGNAGAIRLKVLEAIEALAAAGDLDTSRTHTKG